ncbi:serine/threonine-protein phosphatase BSL2 [Lathyrus oleraceus]|uniref:serine/threonine-protein phosphatase BSL2 n=1 Tax=Pisum sativum TaxID=3888 RepID=UPI0021CFE081|nr:serine/threonine-protein phosphatase BSL2-like [Pisum sativum]
MQQQQHAAMELSRKHKTRTEAISAALAVAKARQENGEVELPDRDCGAEATPSVKHASSPIKLDSVGSNNNVSGGVRLHHRAEVVAAGTGEALGGMARQLSIDQFESEGRRVSYGAPENATAARKLIGFGLRRSLDVASD